MAACETPSSPSAPTTPTKSSVIGPRGCTWAPHAHSADDSEDEASDRNLATPHVVPALAATSAAGAPAHTSHQQQPLHHHHYHHPQCHMDSHLHGQQRDQRSSSAPPSTSLCVAGASSLPWAKDLSAKDAVSPLSRVRIS